ncbi:hypothetical protein ACN2C6_03275 [Caulobacter sp. ErkDOM-YI]|uniref:hypothetical protein n=1 Tax=unclassified Caulobacter TaxID=2648921 RepID=UPI003AF603E6
MRARPAASACARPVDLVLVQTKAAEVAVAAGLKETVRLEARRTGQRLAPVPKQGPLRLKTRDGLMSLHASGSLSDGEVEAGLAYRLCVEHAGAGLRSALATCEGGGRSHGGFGPRDKAALMRAYLMARLDQMERAVNAAAQDGRELLALRLIAGDGRTLTSITAAGNAKLAYLAALRRALAAVASVLRVKRGLAHRDG